MPGRPGAAGTRGRCSFSAQGLGTGWGGCPAPSAWGFSRPSCRRGCAAMAPVKVEEATLTARETAAVAAVRNEMKRANCSGKVAV